jgi:FAD/FMN-containing dehydrogenase
MVKVSMTMVSNLLTRVPPLFADLAKILAGEIDCSVATLATYSVDGSPFLVMPQAVVYPKNGADIKHVLAFAREYKMPVTVRGEGTSRSGGSLGEGIILDMTRYFGQIRNINMVENTITVDAGVSLSSLIKKLNAWHFDIPLITPHDNAGTVGAFISTKCVTGSSFSHGTVREWIEEITIVLDNGEEHKIADGITPSGRLLGIYQGVFPTISKESPVLRAAKPKVHDDSTGYNLWSTSIGPRQLIDQITGGEGTLGIITSVTFRITPHKPYTTVTYIPIFEKKYLPKYIEIAKHHKAATMFLYDEAFMQLSERYYPTVTPFFSDIPYVLLVTHTSVSKEKLHHDVESFKNSLPLEKHFLKTFEGTENFLRITSTDFAISLCNSYTSSKLTPITLCDGIIIPMHHLDAFLCEIEDYLNSLGRLYTITGNIGSGHISILALFDASSKNYSTEILFYAKNIFSLVKKYDGGISASSGEGLLRTPFLSYIYNETTLDIFKKIKDIWDPLYILNPGKKIGTTTNYLTQHFKHEG